MNRLTTAIAAAALCAASLITPTPATAATPVHTTAADTAPQGLVGKWTLVNTWSWAANANFADYSITMNIEAHGGVSGHAVCNSWGGRGQFEGNTIAVPAMLSNPVICDPGQDAASAAMGALAKGSTWFRDGDYLVLLRPGVLLVFTTA